MTCFFKFSYRSYQKRPVQANVCAILPPSAHGRTKIAGHPGAPPPVPTRKKQRKHYTHRYVGGEQPLELHIPVPRARDNLTQGPDRSYTGGGGLVASRSSKDCNEQRGSSIDSGEGFRPGVVRSISPRENELLSCCSVPASVVNASSLSPECSRHEQKKVVHAETRSSLEVEPNATAAAAATAVGMTRKSEARRTRRTRIKTSSSDGARVVYGRAIATQTQADRGGRQDFFLATPAGNKRTSLIRVRKCQSCMQLFKYICSVWYVSIFSCVGGGTT